VHIDLSEPYCPHLRGHLLAAAQSLDLKTSEGVYVCAEGPHLESPAQIRMMRQFGDVVGMTGYPEVVLAREAELCYASICIVTNHAAGMEKSGMYESDMNESDMNESDMNEFRLKGRGSFSASDIPGRVAKCREEVREVIYQAAQRLEEKGSCHCRESLSRAAL